VKQLGGIDILVSNAAHQNREELAELTPEEFDRTRDGSPPIGAVSIEGDSSARSQHRTVVSHLATHRARPREAVPGV